MLAVATIVAVVLSSRATGNALSRGAVALDQREIGTYETGAEAAYDPKEQESIEDEYEAAMPFRDPGHLSRAEIRFARALKASGTTSRDETWDYIHPLWAKYLQAMKDPSEVMLGLTNPRELSEDANPLQKAVEMHAYGAEGHREPPSEGWDVGAPAAGGKDFEWDRDIRHDMGMERPDEGSGGTRTAMPHMMRENKRLKIERISPRDARSSRGMEQPTADSAISHMMRAIKRLKIEGSSPSKQEARMYKMMQSELDSLQDLHDEIASLHGDRAQQDDSLRQRLTYQVMKDKLVQSRLEAKVADEKANVEKNEVHKMLVNQKAQMDSMEKKISDLARIKRAPARHRRSYMSAKDAQRDLQSYFSALDHQERKQELLRGKTMLARLTRFLGAPSGGKAEQQALPPPTGYGPGYRGATESAPEPATRVGQTQTHRGSVREGMSSARPVRSANKAHKQQLYTIDDPSSARRHHHKGLSALVQELKSATTNVAPYLPV